MSWLHGVRFIPSHRHRGLPCQEATCGTREPRGSWGCSEPRGLAYLGPQCRGWIRARPPPHFPHCDWHAFCLETAKSSQMPVPERPWEARTGGGPHIHTCKGTALCFTHTPPQCQSVLLPVGSDGHAFLIPAGSHGGMRGTWRVPLAPGPRGWQGVGRAPLTPAASSGDSSVTSVLSQILSDVSMATFTRISWNIRCLSWKGPRRSAPSTPSAHREESGLRECAYLGGGQRVPHAQQGPCLRAPLPARVPLPEIADR